MVQRLQSIAYGTAVIAWPLGWLLLLRSALDEKPSSLRAAAAGCAAFSVVCGGADVTSFASKMVSQMPKVDQKAASKMRSRLAGRTIGYFAGIGGDRVWWLSKYSSWGALLDCRIVRLDVVPVAENYAQFERQYGPPALLGGRFADVKADPVALGISLTRAMDIRVIAQPEGTRVPSPLRPGLRKIGVLDGMTFFELKGDETGTTSP